MTGDRSGPPEGPGAGHDVGTVFTAAAADFATWESLLWEPMGRRAVVAAAIRPGERILDACCGSGGSALPAALATGPSGLVHAVDLSPGLLARGRTLAGDCGFANVDFVAADVRDWTGAGYDVVICCYGVFFFADMDGAVRQLLGRLRAGGRFAILTWATAAMADVAPLIVDTIRRHHPGWTAPASGERARRIATPCRLADWLCALGAEAVEVQYVAHEVSLSPERAWSLVVGTGFRAMLPPDRGRWPTIRHELAHSLSDAGISAIRLDSLLAHGRWESTHRQQPHGSGPATASCAEGATMMPVPDCHRALGVRRSAGGGGAAYGPRAPAAGSVKRGRHGHHGPVSSRSTIPVTEHR